MAGVVAVLVWGGFVRGEGQPAVALHYEATDQCPDQAVFVEHVQSRAPGFRPLPRAPTLYRVTARATESGATGRLEVTGPAGVVLTREVTSATCDGVVSVLAFVTALALSQAAPAPAPAPQVSPEATVPSPLSAPREQGWEAGVSLAGNTVPAPGGARGGEVFVGVRATGPGRFASALRLTGMMLRNGEVEAGSVGVARFRLLGGRAEGCPVRLRLGSSADMRPCVFYELGSLRAEGREVPLPQAGAGLYSALGASGRLAWRWGWGFAELRAALVIPLFSRTFYFDVPRVEVHTTPPVGAAAGVGLGVQFL